MIYGWCGYHRCQSEWRIVKLSHGIDKTGQLHMIVFAWRKVLFALVVGGLGTGS